MWSFDEIAILRTLPFWSEYNDWVRKMLRVSAPRALAAHTTAACQPGKVPGPAGPEGSLRTCGLEKVLYFEGQDGGSLPYVQIRLPGAFVHGDGLEIRFVSLVSRDLDTPEKVQRHACI